VLLQPTHLCSIELPLYTSRVPSLERDLAVLDAQFHRPRGNSRRSVEGARHPGILSGDAICSRVRTVRKPLHLRLSPHAFGDRIHEFGTSGLRYPSHKKVGQACCGASGGWIHGRH
jgi:hypothetical protein